MLDGYWKVEAKNENGQVVHTFVAAMTGSQVFGCNDSYAFRGNFVEV